MVSARSALLVLLALLLAHPACTRGRGGGGGGGGVDDDDSAGGDDDGTPWGDDDDTGDDDDFTGPAEEVAASGTLHQAYDWNNYIEIAQSWTDCERLYSLFQGSHAVEEGCPACRVVMAVDSGTASTACSGGFIDTDPLIGMHIGVTINDELVYWSYGTEEWTVWMEGTTTANSFSGTAVAWLTYNPGWWENDQPFEVQESVQLSW
jgi:hypothetical protein